MYLDRTNITIFIQENARRRYIDGGLEFCLLKCEIKARRPFCPFFFWAIWKIPILKKFA